MPTFLKNARNIVADQKTVAMPAAGASAATNGIDLGQAEAGRLEGLEVVIEAPALPNLAAAKTAVTTLQHSADDVSYADIPELSAITQTGAAEVGGAAAVERRVRLPPSALQYVRAQTTVLAAGGDNTAATLTLSALV
jgi:hypothetical protein